MKRLIRIGKAALPYIVLTVCGILSLTVGKFSVDWHAVWDSTSMSHRVFVNLRVGRTLTVLAAGIALGVSGYVFQTLFRNPLASPDVVGVASGASVGAAVGIVLLSGRMGMIPLFAFAGGMLAVLLTLGLDAVTDRLGVVSLVVCGVCVNALFQALLTFIKISVDRENKIAAIEFWLMGSFSDVTLRQFGTMLPCLLSSLLGLVLLKRPISLLAYNDDEAAMLGVPVKLVRSAAMMLATLSVASVISTAGLVPFVGLLAPHTARLTKHGAKHPMLSSARTGALLLLAADILARSLPSAELPVGVITSILGVPTLFVLLHRRKVHGN